MRKKTTKSNIHNIVISVKNTNILVVFMIISFALIAIIVINEAFRVGSIQLVAAGLQGEHLITVNSSKAILFEAKGDKIDLHYTIKNISSKSITVLGSTTTCTCTTLEKLPIKFGPHESRDLIVKVTAPRIGSFKGGIELYTDDTQNQVVTLTFTGRVVRKR